LLKKEKPVDIRWLVATYLAGNHKTDYIQ